MRARVAQHQLGVAAQGDHLVHLLEAHGDDAEAGHEFVEPLLAQVVQPLACRVPLVRHLFRWLGFRASDLPITLAHRFPLVRHLFRAGESGFTT